MSAGYPGTFPGALTTGYRNIGAVQRVKTGTAGYPGAFPGALTTGYETIGAVQKQETQQDTQIKSLLNKNKFIKSLFHRAFFE